MFRSAAYCVQGQYKSTVICNTCGAESCTFEPFTLLQLPLPEPVHRFITVTRASFSRLLPRLLTFRARCRLAHVLECNASRPRAVVFRGNVRRALTVSVKVPKTATLAALKAGVAGLRPGVYGAGPDVPVVQVHADELVAVRVFSHAVTWPALPDDTALSQIRWVQRRLWWHSRAQQFRACPCLSPAPPPLWPRHAAGTTTIFTSTRFGRNLRLSRHCQRPYR